jgi:hypothetical protein
MKVQANYSDYSEEEKKILRERVHKSYIKNKGNKLNYAKRYRDAHLDKIRKDNERNRDRRKETNKILNSYRRKTFLDMYGNKCACCGETIVEFLTIEHKNGQKGLPEHKKKSGGRAYKIAIQEYRPDLYEILCWNCNCARGRYGYCPHQK